MTEEKHRETGPIAKEWSAFARCVDWSYEKFTVPLTVLIIALYVAPWGDWRAYIIVPSACFYIPLLLTKFLIFCHQRGILRYIYDTVHAFVSGAFIKLWLGVAVLRQSKPGQVSLWLALINLVGFSGYWCYTNVDLLKLGRSLWLMIHTLATSLRNPVAIMHSFQETLRTLSVYKAMESVRLSYVNQTVQSIDDGSVSVLITVACVTAVLFLCALFFYFFPNVIWPSIVSTARQQGSDVVTTYASRADSKATRDPIHYSK